MRKLPIAVIYAFVSGCSSGSAGLAAIELSNPALEAPPIENPIDESQGRTLVGTAWGEPEPVVWMQVPNGITVSNSGTLWHRRHGNNVPVGIGDYVYGNGGNYALLIVRTDLPQSSSDEFVNTMDPVHKTTTLYTPYFVDDWGRATAPFCKPDINGSIQAVAAPGYFDAKGVLHRDAPSVFTFACLSGVIGKCAKWKYLPWEVPDLNWACTRAARADYCGTGETHTVENTPVGVYDSNDPPFRTQAVASSGNPGAPLGTFESAWTTAGAFCVTHARWPQLIDKAGTQLCGKSTQIIDKNGDPYICGGLDWAIKQEPKHDPPISGPLIAIDSGYNILPQ